jgi:heat shock protein HslJ
MKKTIAILALAALAACAGGADENPLKGHEFASRMDGTRITLNFDQEQARLSGKVVNTYNAPYELAGDNIVIKRMSATLMMPIGKAADVERDYFKFMGDAEPKSYRLENGMLTLTDHDGTEYKFERIK